MASFAIRDRAEAASGPEGLHDSCVPLALDQTGSGPYPFKGIMPSPVGWSKRHPPSSFTRWLLSLQEFNSSENWSAEEWVGRVGVHIELDTGTHNPNTPRGRWDANTAESPETHRPAYCYRY